MVMRLVSPATPPQLFPNPGPKPPACAVAVAAAACFSLRLRRARAAAVAGAAAAGGPDRDGGRFEGEAMGGAFDRGLAVIARKVPLFEPAGEGDLAAAAGEKPLPINLELWLYRAKVHTRKFEFPEAEKLLDKCISFWPEDGRPYVALGKLYSKHFRFDKARAVYERGCQATQGENPYIWQAWAQVEMRAGNNIMARKLFEKAVEASPKNRFSWHIWALFEANEGLGLDGVERRKCENSKNPLSTSLSINSTNECAARCLQAWGVLEQRAGNYTAARRLLRSSLNINSQSEVTWMTWAALEEEQGDPVRAEEIRNLYFQQRTEVVDDASWVMGFLDIIDPALDSVKKLLNLDQQSGPAGQNNVESTTEPSRSSIRSSTGEEYSETSATGGSDGTALSNNAKGNEEAAVTPESSFDLDGFIKRRLGLDPTELDAVLEGSDPKGVVSQRRKRRLPRKPLPLLPVP
ncbi:hypothetical protein PR202_gb19647 [Eleusine coracana subsp. coracana]|uniref:Uncharacterized protein n=1 Tax=Eleusine coracana subsp. coracana TaxID=191504 RepID=A0AAV5F9E6_ELECO|nr:hypothetical protein PR202_gb19647 [Eleusine coracana subsp. coracana]